MRLVFRNVAEYIVILNYRQISHISRALFSNKIVDLSALLQQHLNSPRNSWLQYIAQRQLQDETRNVYILQIGATYIRDLTVPFTWHDISWSTRSWLR